MDGTLFRHRGVFVLFDDLKGQMQNEIGALSIQELDGDLSALAKRIVAQYAPKVPVLHEDQQYATHEEIELDVSGDPFEQFMHGDYSGAPIRVKATEITVAVPFEGDPDLFWVQPSTFFLSTPLASVVGQELRFKFTVRQGDTGVKKRIDQAMEIVRVSLDRLRSDSLQLQAKAEVEALPLLTARKLDLESRASLVDSLGIPVRNLFKAEVPATRAKKPVRNSHGTPEQRTSKTWDVFISHASEDKDEIARPLARALEAAGLTVWFDEKSLRLGDSLRAKIDEGLSNSRYGVIILSKRFFEKRWPQQELNGMAAMEVGGRKVILPVWHDLTDNDVRVYSPLLADRIAVSTEKGLPIVVAQIVTVVKGS